MRFGEVRRSPAWAQSPPCCPRCARSGCADLACLQLAATVHHVCQAGLEVGVPVRGEEAQRAELEGHNGRHGRTKQRGRVQQQTVAAEADNEVHVGVQLGCLLGHKGRHKAQPQRALRGGAAPVEVSVRAAARQAAAGRAAALRCAPVPSAVRGFTLSPPLRSPGRRSRGAPPPLAPCPAPLPSTCRRERLAASTLCTTGTYVCEQPGHMLRIARQGGGWRRAAPQQPHLTTSTNSAHSSSPSFFRTMTLQAQLVGRRCGGQGNMQRPAQAGLARSTRRRRRWRTCAGGRATPVAAAARREP